MVSWTSHNKPSAICLCVEVVQSPVYRLDVTESLRTAPMRITAASTHLLRGSRARHERVAAQSGPRPADPTSADRGRSHLATCLGRPPGSGPHRTYDDRSGGR